MSKATLRATLFARRDLLAEQVRYGFSNLICRYLLDQLPTTQINIGSYVAHGSEVTLELFHQQIFSSHHQLFVPRIQSRTEMEMSRLASETDLVKGRFGIQTSKQDQTSPFDSLNWLIMPCTGFDRRGHRLGMGEGFYDRALEKCSQSSPLKIGVSFNCQEIEFEPDDWDVPFNWILTETGFIRQ